jgi:hypothetical protein
MSKGGFRPFAGRKTEFEYFIKGKKYKNLNDAAAANGVVKSTISKWCKSAKRPDCWHERKKYETPLDLKGKNENLLPLDYMLTILRDESQPPERRDRMAYLCAPYIHTKPTEKTGKKLEQKERAKVAAVGKFKPRPAPSNIIKMPERVDT